LSAYASESASAELFWLVGADVVRSFARWREPKRITELATVVVLQRTDEAPDLASIPGTPRCLATRRIDISSTEVRDRVRKGKSIRGFVPDAVAAYIAAQRLYR
jgi:nicotinate-nucleotide adenylyltransferase